MKKGLCRSNILALCFIVTVAEVNFFFFYDLPFYQGM